MIVISFQSVPKPTVLQELMQLSDHSWVSLISGARPPEKSTFCTINNRVGTLRPMFVRLNTLSTNMLYCCTVDRCMEFVFFFFHLTEPNACKEVAWICRELNQCAYVSLETTCWTVGNSCFDHWRRAIGDFWLVYSIPDIILSGLAQSIN